MTVVGELTVPAREFALGETLAAVPDAVAEFERIVTHSQEWVMPYLWVRSDDLERVDREVARDGSVSEATVAEEFDHTRLYRVVWTDSVEECVNVVFDRAGTLLEAKGQGDRWEILVRFDGKEEFADLQRHFDRSDSAFTLRRVLTQSTRGAEFELSAEQREALVAAVGMGYYDIPRRTDLATVAEELQITPPSASERLRRAITSITRQTLLVGDALEMADAREQA